MDLKNKHIWSGAFHCVGITVLAILLAVLVVCGLASLSVFSPLEKSADFQMSDLYQSVAESKPVHQLSSDITIVSIDGCSRDSVLETVNLISEYEPAAIGVDVFFTYPEKDNTYLLNTFREMPNMVCAAKFERDEQGDTWHHAKQSFFEDSIAVTYGYVNLNASSHRDVIRSFVPFVLTSNGDSLFSMPVVLARMYNPESFYTLLSRQNEVETIAFEHIEFRVVSAREVLAGEVSDSLLAERIILIGDTGNIHDSYLSPLHDPMPGVMLNAYSLQTILSSNYIDTTPSWLNWLIAIVLCALLTICNLVAKYRMSNVGNLFVRIAQFVIIYLLIVIGCAFFASHHRYIDFFISILMIGLGLVAFDIWFGFVALYNFIKDKISKK
jgi:CHASE2 domain-containing sensor protein